MTDNDPLNKLFWRDEVLQIAYWFQGEGLGDIITAEELLRFLPADAPDIEVILSELAADNFFEVVGYARYKLTDLGHKEGGRRFADAFDELTKPAHMECSADCACHTTGDVSACSHRHEHHH